MPIYEYQTEDGEVIEHICSYKDKPKYLVSNKGRRALPIMSGIAYTPNSWGVEWRRGMTGGASYDPYLGATIYSEKHRDEILRQRGLVRESDLPKGWIDDQNEKKVKFDEWQDERADQFQNLLDEHNVDADNPEACHDAIVHVYEEWMPSKPALDGEFSKTINDF